MFSVSAQGGDFEGLKRVHAENMDKLSRRKAIGLGISGAVAAAAGGVFGYNILRRRQPNIVFIVSDALRADRLGCYGYRREVDGAQASLTPNIDSLAGSGIVFERCVTPSSWTLPSVASIMSSRLPFVEGELYNEGFVVDGCRTGAQILKGHGYETMALVKNPWLYVHTETGKRDIVAARGFQRYLTGYMNLVDNPLFAKGIGQKQVYSRFSNAKEATEQAFGTLKQLRNPRGPFFLYIHYMDTHEPYNPPEEYKQAVCRVGAVDGIPDYMLYQAIRTYAKARGEERLSEEEMGLFIRARELYDASVRFVDEWVGKLVKHLEGVGLWDSTVLVFSSDHGEEFGEHGWIGHSKSLYEESVRAPLVVTGPGVARGARVGGIVRGIDIIPTILSVAGAEVAETMHGKALGLSGEEDEAPPEAVSALVRPDGPDPLTEKIYSITDARGLKFIRTEYIGEKAGLEASSELYDLRRDGGEQANIAGEKGELVAALVRQVELARKESGAREGSVMELDEELRRRLKSLGYIN